MTKVIETAKEKLERIQIDKKIAEAMDMMDLPDLSRSPYAFMQRIDAPLGFDGFAGISPSGDRFLVGQGSNEWLDWIVNFDKYANDQGYHPGFQKSLELSLREINKLIIPELLGEGSEEIILSKLAKRMKAEEKWFYIGGFSNGGAVAVLLAERLAANGLPVRLATWGQPKVMLKDHLYQLQAIAHYSRYVHPLDPVPWTPYQMGHSGTKRKVFWFGFPRSLKSYLQATLLQPEI